MPAASLKCFFHGLLVTVKHWQCQKQHGLVLQACICRVGCCLATYTETVLSIFRKVPNLICWMCSGHELHNFSHRYIFCRGYTIKILNTNRKPNKLHFKQKLSIKYTQHEVKFMQINFLNRTENKASNVFKNSKDRTKFVSKTLFVFNVFIVYLPELD